RAEDGARERRAGRLSPGAVAGAALAGVVLLASPFGVAALTGHLGGTDGQRQDAQPLPDDADGRGHGAVPVPGASPGQRHGHDGDGKGEDGKGGKDGGEHTAGHRGDEDDGGAKDGSGGADGDKESGGSDDKASDGEGGSGARAQVKSSGWEYTEVAGPGCGGYQEIGAYGDGKEGWLTRKGGSSSGGCSGDVRALPMSGDSSPDSDLTAYWTFAPGMKSASCRVSVYVPKGDSPLVVGGSPAHYSVHGGTKWYGNDLAGFHVDQPSHQGSWVTGTTVRVSGGRFTVRLTNAGKDWNSGGKTYAHIAAAQVKAQCRTA
ncbi:hypothetical protein HLB32_01880, partial [Streptomyces cacaoi]